MSVYGELFRVSGVEVPDWWPRFNIKPTNSVLAVRQDEGELKAGSMRWGLVPSWWKKPLAEMKAATFNAVGEEIHEKPMYRAAWKQRKRCLIASDGLYEWETVGKEKLPWHIRPKGGGPFAFAGVYDCCPQLDGSVLESCTILTTQPSDWWRTLHHRQAVILTPDLYDAWLDPDVPPEAAQEMLQPLDDRQLERYRVSKAVNSIKAEGPELIAPLVV